MGKDNNNQDNLKIIFSLISFFLMIPPLLNNEAGYYRTLFIFLINRVIDMFYKVNTEEHVFFTIWALINQWLGVIACAIAFCSITPDFQKTCEVHASVINIAIFVIAVSCILKDMLGLIVISVREKLIIEKIKEDMNRRGER